MNGNIFISYRREDSLGSAGRMYDRLRTKFSSEQIFMDVDNIPPGEDFISYLEKAVEKCDILLAVIGRTWLQVTDSTGKRRLDDPYDFVRSELRIALQRGIRVIPILMENDKMPKTEDLPEDLKQICRRNAYQIHHIRFDSDCEKLITFLSKELEAIESNKKINTDTVTDNIELSAWQLAQKINTIEGYERYLSEISDGAHKYEALYNIQILEQEAFSEEYEEEEMLWAEALIEGTEVSYQKYLDNTTLNSHSEKAKNAIAELKSNLINRIEEEWLRAKKLDTLESYQLYMKKYPDSSYASFAKANMNKLLKFTEGRTDSSGQAQNLIQSPSKIETIVVCLIVVILILMCIYKVNSNL